MNLPLLQISDSALPIGGYMHSWGLEAALAQGLVRDSETLEGWIRSWLRHSLVPMEGVIVASVCRSVLADNWSALPEANNLTTVSINPPTLRNSSWDMGEQLLSLARTWTWSRAGIDKFVRQFSGGPQPCRWHHSVIFGMLGGLAASPPMETLAVFLHQATLGMIAAGVRAIPVGHTHGQQILAYLHPDLQELAFGYAERLLETAGSSCPFHEVLCNEQTFLYSRMFRS